MSEQKRRLLMLLVVGLLVCVATVQSVVDPMYLKMVERRNPIGGGNSKQYMVQLPGQFIVASFAGFREVIAGALWIRADTFFHQGNFRAILPIVRLVTWLDPHNIDVYTTGAWHMDYNFTDEINQMSDKRYIPPAVALLKEGIRNNPDIWDLYFELGWTHYNRKLMDYDTALEYIEKACKLDGADPNTGERVPRPGFVDNMLAHSYEKCGRYDDAIKAWEQARKNLLKLMASDKKRTNEFYDQSSMDVIDRNLSSLYLRLGWRYGDMEMYKRGVEITKRLSNRKSPAVIKWAAEGAIKDYQTRVATNRPPHDVFPPIDLGFEASVRRIAPRILDVRGKINLMAAKEYKNLASEVFTHWYQNNEKAGVDRKQLWQDGCRVMWKLEDYDYKMPNLDVFDPTIDTSKMIVWDSFSVSGGSFYGKIDLSDPRDAEMYPFKAKKYRLTLWMMPQDPGCPDFVQDRVGWKGEAFSDKNYLLKDTIITPRGEKHAPGFRAIKKVIVLNRGDIL